MREEPGVECSKERQERVTWLYERCEVYVYVYVHVDDYVHVVMYKGHLYASLKGRSTEEKCHIERRDQIWSHRIKPVPNDLLSDFLTPPYLP